MGNWLHKTFSGLLSLDRDARILMLGLDAAGKTTVLYKLKLGETTITPPTIGFNVERVKFQNIQFTIWDIGGQDKIRKLWHHYFQGTDGLIWVVDSNDRERIDEAATELQSLLRADELRDATILILANKQDLPGALSTAEIVNAFGLPSLRNRKWHVQGTCARTGDGLVEGLGWLSNTVASAQ